VRIGAHKDVTRPHVPVLDHQLVANALADVVEVPTRLPGKITHHLVQVGDPLVGSRGSVIDHK
jgi:hypothetical protein